MNQVVDMILDAALGFLMPVSVLLIVKFMTLIPELYPMEYILLQLVCFSWMCNATITNMAVGRLQRRR